MNRKSRVKKITIISIIMYICYIVVTQQVTIKSKKAQLEKRKAELSNITNEHQKMLDKTKMSETYRYVEKLARERLGFIKQGENAVIQEKK